MLNEYPAVPVAGGIQLQLGDAYAEERRRVVFELGIPRLASLGVAKVADVVLRYVSVGQELAARRSLWNAWPPSLPSSAATTDKEIAA